MLLLFVIMYLISSYIIMLLIILFVTLLYSLLLDNQKNPGTFHPYYVQIGYVIEIAVNYRNIIVHLPNFYLLSPFRLRL